MFEKFSTRTIVLTALLTAIITLSTMVIQIPLPISGYVNLGDVFVLVSAFILGPLYGALAAGLGSALADVLSGYVIFALGTLIIKATMAFVFYIVLRSLSKIFKHKIIATIISSVIAEIIMTIGYFLYSCLIMSEGLSAAASIPGNLIQGAIGIVGGISVISIIERIKINDNK